MRHDVASSRVQLRMRLHNRFPLSCALAVAQLELHNLIATTLSCSTPPTPLQPKVVAGGPALGAK